MPLSYGILLPSATDATQEELLSSLGLDVTITRREDATFAPNGYIYNVYFDGEMQVKNNKLEFLSCVTTIFCNKHQFQPVPQKPPL